MREQGVPTLFTNEWWAYLDSAVENVAISTAVTPVEAFNQVMRWLLGSEERMLALLQTGDLQPVVSALTMLR